MVMNWELLKFTDNNNERFPPGGAKCSEMPLTPSAENKAEANKGKIKGVPQVGFRDSNSVRRAAQALSLPQLHIPGSIFPQLVTDSVIIKMLWGKQCRNGGNQSIWEASKATCIRVVQSLRVPDKGTKFSETFILKWSSRKTYWPYPFELTEIYLHGGKTFFKDLKLAFCIIYREQKVLKTSRQPLEFHNILAFSM